MNQLLSSRLLTYSRHPALRNTVLVIQKKIWNYRFLICVQLQKIQKLPFTKQVSLLVKTRSVVGLCTHSRNQWDTHCALGTTLACAQHGLHDHSWDSDWRHLAQEGDTSNRRARAACRHCRTHCDTTCCRQCIPPKGTQWQMAGERVTPLRSATLTARSARGGLAYQSASTGRECRRISFCSSHIAACCQGPEC